MSRATLVSRRFLCTSDSCRAASADPFRLQFWNRKLTGSVWDDRGGFEPTFWQLRCPHCGANPSFFIDPDSRNRSREFSPHVFSQLPSHLRPVVYRWLDKDGHEHYRYPATADGHDQRPTEERIEFAKLRSMEQFLKEQNPNYRDWQIPLNDVLDYDEAHLDAVAADETDPGVAEDAEAALGPGAEDFSFGTADREEIAALMARTDGRALIEKA